MCEPGKPTTEGRCTASGRVAFWAIAFIKSTLRNRLDKHLETCMLLHQPPGSFQLFDQETFPYEKAVERRFSKKK
jgi:hypothetical protein